MADAEVIFDLSSGFAEAEEQWRALEQTGHGSPYQQFDWARAWWEHIGKHKGITPHVLRLARGDETLALLAVGFRRHLGLTVARPIGERHFNIHMPLWATGAAGRVTPGEYRRALVEACRRLGADVLCFAHQPDIWAGSSGHAAAGEAGTSSGDVYLLPLTRDFTALARARRSKRYLQQIRRKREGLAVRAGPVSFRRADDEATCARVIAEAVRHRSERRQHCGVPSFLHEAGGPEFIRDLTLRGLGAPEGRCVMAAHYLEAGSQIIATYFGSGFNGHYACFVNSFDMAYEECSPGDILLHDLIANLCSLGLGSLDLGVGEGRYKEAWCDPLPLFASTEALTPLGSIYAGSVRASGNAKRIIRNNNSLWHGWRSVRKLRAQFRSY